MEELLRQINTILFQGSDRSTEPRSSSIMAAVEPVITLQPIAGPTTYAFDPISEAQIQLFPIVHKNHHQLKEIVDQATSDVVKKCQDNRVFLRNGLTYEQFLAGMLFKDEQMLLSNQFLNYNHVVFHQIVESGETFVVKTNMTQGKAVLTNHRIILLSAEEAQGLNIASHGNQSGNKPATYLLSGSCTDALYYQSIPLGCVKNVEYNASSGTTTRAIINSHPCCMPGPLFGCCCCCLDEKWAQDGISSSALTHRILTIGAILPPWGRKYMVQIHVKEDVQPNIVKDFLVDMQHFVPALYTGAMPRNE